MENSPDDPSNSEKRLTGGGLIASPWVRLGAVLIDGIVVCPIYLILMQTLGRVPVIGVFVTQVICVAALIGINFNFLKKGQTIGKLALKLQIQRRGDGSLLPVQELIMNRILPIQGASMILTAIHPVFGLIAIADGLCIFRPQRNTIHDDIAGTKVVVLDVRPELETGSILPA